mgnify:CR=1 FL=1
MVDTLVLGTSANAWEFESLHAQTIGDRLNPIAYSFIFIFCMTKFPAPHPSISLNGQKSDRTNKGTLLIHDLAR